MAGLEQPDEGHVEVGETIKIGYLAQEELPIKDSNQRVIDYVKEIGEYVQTRDGRISASQMLERFARSRRICSTLRFPNSPVEKSGGCICCPCWSAGQMY